MNANPLAPVMLLVLLLMASCAAQAPANKPAFPRDIVPVCYEGQIGLASPSAEEVFLLPIPCKPQVSA